MTDDDLREFALRPGLVWGFDFVDGRAEPVAEADIAGGASEHRGFRWLHFNLADQRTLRWLTAARPVSPHASDLFLSPDPHQRYVIEGEALGLVLHDLEMDLIHNEPTVSPLMIAASPTLIVTARRHPLRSADIVKQRIDAGAPIDGAPAALELIFTALTEVFRAVNDDLDAQVQAIEDELLRERPKSDARTFIAMRSLMVRMHRLFTGARAMLRRLEDETGAPRALLEAASRFIDRLSSIDSELLSAQSQLRLLRDEMDLQATQQTNSNLYFLSILSALLLPATLVTGIFGMNTGGLIWTDSKQGSLWATGAALGSAGVVYLILRLTGFIRR